jgi:hypothetical protein
MINGLPRRFAPRNDDGVCGVRLCHRGLEQTSIFNPFGYRSARLILSLMEIAEAYSAFARFANCNHALSTFPFGANKQP